MTALDITTAHRTAAEQLVLAETARIPCAPVRTLFESPSIDDAYVVQSLVQEQTGQGRRRLGCKIGLTSAAVQRQMGVGQPDFGVLYADMALGDGEVVPEGRLIQPRLEAEIAFVLGRDLPECPVVLTDIIRATEFVVAAIEIVDSRIANWDISIMDTVADNASSGMFVLGGCPRRLRDINDLASMRMKLTAGETVVSEGDGAACLGHPINAVVWLANELAKRGAPVRAGDLILSGSLGPLVPAADRMHYRASIEGLGTVRTSFGER
jgi:2-keto-4-pentenoate hydratase